VQYICDAPGRTYSDPYRTEGDAIAAREEHFGRMLRRENYNPLESGIP
jgi:hypothetical protein